MYVIAGKSHSVLDESDGKRRGELREFLTKMRARLRPGQVGLPQISRRRVPGLRRPEVAELVGVSEDWYRWFESGRPISVSPKFLSRVACALRLDPPEEVALYRLALPELYRADVAACRLHCYGGAQCGDQRRGATSASAQPAGVRIRTTYPVAVCS